MILDQVLIGPKKSANRRVIGEMMQVILYYSSMDVLKLIH